MINLNALKYFYDSCRLGSMTKAAEVNFISRPAISQALKKIEEELGVKLLNHQRRGFEPTQAGILLAEHAKKIFSQLDDTNAILKGTTGKLHGQLRIGSARTLVAFELKNAIRKFHLKHEDVNLKIRIYNSSELVRKLSDKELDLAIFLGDELLQDHKQVVLRKGHFCLVKPKKPTIEKLSFAITESRPEVEKLKHLYEKKYSSPLPVFAEIHSWDAIWSWVNEGFCGGLIPDFLFDENKKSPHKESIVIDKIWPYEIKAMFADSRVNDPLIKGFLENI